jgi:CAAX protease family protein
VSIAKIRGVGKLLFIPAIFAYPIIAILGNVMSFLVGWEKQLAIIKPGPDTLGLFVLPIMALQFTASLITSPLFEEPDWRGFALTRLQARFGTLIGSIIVGSLWWLWHQPMNLTFGIQPSVYGFLSMVALFIHH